MDWHGILEEELATPNNPINRRRSERVMLQMRIMVIADDIEHKSRQEEALTLIVNAHGGLLKMKMDVHVGQPMKLLNLHNKMQQGCRVVRVEDTSPEFFNVAFEFDQPNPNFWPVVFPPADWNAPPA